MTIIGVNFSRLYTDLHFVWLDNRINDVCPEHQISNDDDEEVLEWHVVLLKHPCSSSRALMRQFHHLHYCRSMQLFLREIPRRVDEAEEGVLTC